MTSLNAMKISKDKIKVTTAADAAEMFHEMSTVGVTMAVLVTAVWAVMCVAADAIMKRKPAKNAA